MGLKKYSSWRFKGEIRFLFRKVLKQPTNRSRASKNITSFTVNYERLMTVYLLSSGQKTCIEKVIPDLQALLLSLA